MDKAKAIKAELIRRELASREGQKQPVAQQGQENNFQPSENTVVRNTLDPFMQAGIETARGFHKGSAAVATPLAMVLKAMQVPEKYNLFEQARVENDKSATKLPKTNLDPVSKYVFQEVAAMPGYVATFEQLSPVLKPMLGAAKQGGKLLKDFINSDKSLTESAYQTTLKARDAFKGWAGNLSKRFGAEYEALIGGKTTTMEKYAQALDQSVNNLGIQNVEKSALSGTDRALKNELDRVAGIIEKDPNMRQGAVRLDEIDSMLKKGMFKSKPGKYYSPADHTLTEVRSNLSELLSEEIPGLKVMKSKYAPELQFKNKAFKVLEPYQQSGEYEASKGISFFRDAAKGKLKPDDAKMLESIQKDFSPGLLDDLLEKGRVARAAELTGSILKPTAKVVGGGALAAAGWDIGKHIIQ